jgi:glycosyltransferase involved in cell wall biosynthesis
MLIKKKNQPSITIITVVKNRENTIQKTINSVLNQSFKDLEYIVIDGKSNDRTFNIIKKNKKNITKYVSRRDKNLYDALNTGIKLSHGKYIGILHAGDTYNYKDSIKDSFDFLESNNLDFMYSNLVMNDGNKIFRFINARRYRPFFLKFGIQPPHPTLFVKSEIFKNFFFYSIIYRIAGDFELFVRLFNKKKKLRWMHLDKITVRQSRGGISDTSFINKIRLSSDLLKILKDNSIFSIRIFFLIKFFTRIKEIILKANVN